VNVQLGGLAPDIAAALERALTDGEIGRDDALLLSGVEGDALDALIRVADLLRARQAGELVTYVVNRNINFTNVCVKSCGFCAFSRDLRSEQGYYLPLEEVVRRATEAAAMGATEVCVQAGLAPRMTGGEYA
jgi:FO synthase subunit 2